MPSVLSSALQDFLREGRAGCVSCVVLFKLPLRGLEEESPAGHQETCFLSRRRYSLTGYFTSASVFSIIERLVEPYPYKKKFK